MRFTKVFGPLVISVASILGSGGINFFALVFSSKIFEAIILAFDCLK